MAVVNYILGNTPKDFDFDAANVNNDEVITIADAVGIVNMILNEKSGSAKAKLHP